MAYFEKVDTYAAEVQKFCKDNGLRFEDFLTSLCRIENDVPPDRERMRHELYDIFLRTTDMLRNVKSSPDDALQMTELCIRIYNALEADKPKRTTKKEG